MRREKNFDTTWQKIGSVVKAILDSRRLRAVIVFVYSVIVAIAGGVVAFYTQFGNLDDRVLGVEAAIDVGIEERAEMQEALGKLNKGMTALLTHFGIEIIEP